MNYSVLVLIMQTMAATLVVFLLMIVSFSLNKIPMSLTSFIGMLLLVLFGCVSPADALSTIVNGTTMTIMSMFVISAGICKTGLIPKLTEIVGKISGNSLRKILASYVVVTFILAQFIPSTTAIFAIMCPLVVAVCEEMGVSPSKILYSVGIVTVVTAYTLTPIGPYAANFVENNGLFAQYGIVGFENTVFTEMILKLPATVCIMLWAIFGAPHFAPDKGLTAAVGVIKSSKKESANISVFQEIVCYMAFGVSVVAFVCNNFGLDTWIIPAVGAALVVACGVLAEKEAFNNMGISIVLLYAGTACLGKAFANTGAGELIGNTVARLLGNTHNSYVLGFAVFVAAFVMTSLLYNRAVSKILIPIVLATATTLKCDPRGLIQMCYIGSMSSFITPMATSVVPMMMASGGYNQRDLVKMGWIPAVICCLSTVLFGMTLYPCW